MAKLTSNTSGNFKTYGIKSAYSGRSHAGFYFFIAIVVLLIVVGASVWGVMRHLRNRDANPNMSGAGGRSVSDNSVSELTFADARAFSENPETAAAILEHRAREADPSSEELSFREFEQQRTKQLRQLYDKAFQAFNERKFEQCRTVLRDMLGAMDSSEPLYDTAASLLGRASMNIYRSGTDSETNTAYTVKSGDTLSKIALNYNTSVSAIQKANGMTNTRLNVGQQLRIPQSVWSIVIRRSDNRLVLYANNKLFKIYKIYPGSAIDQSFSGTFRIFSKQKDPTWRVDGQTYPPGSPGNIIGSRWMALKGTGASANAPGTAIHGTNRAGTPDTSAGAPGYFRLSNVDAEELFDLVPCETPIDIRR